MNNLYYNLNPFMNSIKERLAAAYEAKSNDIKTFIWKGPKEELNGQKFQDEIKLIDATDEQLIDFYNHCMSMLYNEDPVNPGRYTLIKMLQDDRDRCNTELYLRYLENVYLPSDDRARYQRFMYLQDMKKFLGQNSEGLPQNQWSSTPITTIIDNVPDEFRNLNIAMVLEGLGDKLSRPHRKPLTLNFLVKMGLWFTPQEMKALTERTEDGRYRDRLDVVKERLDLKKITKLRVDPRGLSYAEFRAMLNLKNKKFSELTTEQLLVLRNKVLFRLEDEASFHADMWLEKIRELRLVAESRGWSFDNDSEQ